MTINLSQYLSIRKTLVAATRPVTLLAVSKNRNAAVVRELYQYRQRQFGENQVDEALPKMQELDDLDDIVWHFIGQIQRNKTRSIAENFDWVQSVDREIIVARLAAQRPATLPALNVLVQVNIDSEAQKGGCLPEQVMDLCRQVQSQHRLRLRGLMAIPEHSPDQAHKRDSLLRLKSCYDCCLEQGIDMDTLSMGMSGDWQLALACGSNMVRIGSAIFGAR